MANAIMVPTALDNIIASVLAQLVLQDRALVIKNTDYETWGSLALMLRASRGIGAAPLRVTRAGAKYLVSSSPRLPVVQHLFTAACNTLMLAAIAWDFTQETSKRIGGETTMQFVVWVCNLLVVQLVANITIYKGPSQMSSLIQVLKQLQQIKFNLAMKAPSGTSETMRSIAIICMLIWAIGIQIIDGYTQYYVASIENKLCKLSTATRNCAYFNPASSNSIVSLYCTYYYFLTVGVVMALQWNCAVRGARAAAAAVNHQLRQLRHDNSLQSSQAEATIRRLALAYTGVSEVVTQLNDGYGAVLHAMITWLFLGLLISPYYIQDLFFYDDAVGVSEVVMEANWTLLYIVTLMVIVEPCHWTHTEMESTRHLLNLLIAYLAPKSERLSLELERFAMQLTLDNETFTPLGIYTLGRPLVTTILGGVSTYLVILIQFQ